jgi:hypothetical protein
LYRTKIVANDVAAIAAIIITMYGNPYSDMFTLIFPILID